MNGPIIDGAHVSAPIDTIMAIYRRDGAVIIHEFLTAEVSERLSRECDGPLADLAMGGDSTDDTSRLFHGTTTKRLNNLLSFSETFRNEVMEHEVLHRVGESLFREEFGDFWLMNTNVIEISPGGAAQPLHRDVEAYPLKYYHAPEAPELVANFLVALTPFTPDHGATRVIPGSHRWQNFEERGDPALTAPAEMPPGSALLFSGKLVHGGGANIAREPRRALSLPIVPGILTPEEAFPFLAPYDVVKALSPRAQRLVGFRSIYPYGTASGLWQSNMMEIADVLSERQ